MTLLSPLPLCAPLASSSHWWIHSLGQNCKFVKAVNHLHTVSTVIKFNYVSLGGCVPVQCPIVFTDEPCCSPWQKAYVIHTHTYTHTHTHTKFSSVSDLPIAKSPSLEIARDSKQPGVPASLYHFYTDYLETRKIWVDLLKPNNHTSHMIFPHSYWIIIMFAKIIHIKEASWKSILI